MDAVGMVPDEQVLIANLANGERFTTYLFEGERGSGVMCVNGAAAHLAKEGDRIIVMAFAQLDEAEVESHRPKVAILTEDNQIDRML
jgi:aspartate 1-decarboxylase